MVSTQSCRWRKSSSTIDSKKNVTAVMNDDREEGNRGEELQRHSRAVATTVPHCHCNQATATAFSSSVTATAADRHRKGRTATQQSGWWCRVRSSDRRRWCCWFLRSRSWEGWLMEEQGDDSHREGLISFSCKPRRGKWSMMMGLAESMRKKSLIFSLAMVMKVTAYKRGDGREMRNFRL